MGSAFGSAGGRSHGETGQAQQLARVVFGVVVVACFVAFAVAQRLKHSPTVVQNFEMTPAFHPMATPAAGCRGRVPVALIEAKLPGIEYLSFKPAQADEVTVEVVDSAGDAVATIVRSLPAERYKQLSLCWNGHRGPRQQGRLAPAGDYRLRVSLRNPSHPPVYSPLSFALEAARR
jgi:hypothetical protein